MSDFMTATITLGTALCLAFPVLLLIFGVLFARAARRGEMDPATQRVGVWLISTGLLGTAVYLALCTIPGLTRLLALDWACVALIFFSAVLGGLFLRGSLKRPLRAVSWVFLTDTLVVAAFLPFAIWLAVVAQRNFAYSNPNETEVRAALARNPNDAAAHTSLARIDSQHRNYAGAMAEWREVLRVEPDNNDALLLLAHELARAHRPDEARALYQKLASGNGPYRDGAQKWLARYGK